ncbi:MAG: hypothetical protein K0Q79_3345 [Flavipsychrobacter sp.]|jgi:hypothetical protein|nr:hypothetical protein [Flavipsychrobacter sp.]
MTNSIIITFPEDNPVQLHVSYSIELADDMQTISCSVEEKHFPIWMQLRKFSIVSRKERNSYIQLYNESNDSKNMATTLFIDHVYTAIMAAGKMKV